MVSRLVAIVLCVLAVAPRAGAQEPYNLTAPVKSLATIFTDLYGPRVISVCASRVTTVSVRLGPRLRNVQIRSGTVIAVRPTPAHLTQAGIGSADHAIDAGLIMNAIAPPQSARPARRRPIIMPIPSCVRSSFSPVD